MQREHALWILESVKVQERRKHLKFQIFLHLEIFLIKDTEENKEKDA